MDTVVREKKKEKKRKLKIEKSRNVASEMCERVNMREIKKMVHILVNSFRTDMCTCPQLLGVILKLIQRYYWSAYIGNIFSYFTLTLKS